MQSIFIRKLQVMIVGKGIWTIMKKELARFFKDGRMCLTTLLLPDSKYNSTGDAVISFLKEIPHDMIDLAIDVRKNDYDGWDNDEFGNIKNGVAILKGKLAT